MRRKASTVVLAIALFAVACTSDPADAPSSTSTPVPAATTAVGDVDGSAPTAVVVTPIPRPTAVVSNLVPTVAELLEIGLTTEEAECFIAEIDPDKTGRITDAELFGIAFATCMGGGAPDS